MTSSQWVAGAVLLLIFGGLLFAFLRHGGKIKPSGRSPDDRNDYS